MALTDLSDWLDEFSGPGFVWYTKRLSGNDTLANESHQAGPYIPKSFLFKVFPAINRPAAKNPDVWFELYIDSHADSRRVRAVWYNNKNHGGTRDEARLTNFGGSRSALLDPESTGALAVFAFRWKEKETTSECHVWVCRHETEEDVIEERIGPVEPGSWTVWPPQQQFLPDIVEPQPYTQDCYLKLDDIPRDWLDQFPSGQEVVHKSVKLRPCDGITVDTRILSRRKCEFEIFRSLEEVHELPLIRRGFANIDDFMVRAQSILQRRKARSGRSLELHAKEIFIEENLREEIDFSHQPESEPNKRPDFLFPSQSAYKDPNFPEARLRMLAVKTTCRDRWRQVLNEADRVARKHLLTLQEGVSENQFREMCDNHVQLVVPSPLITKYPDSVQPHLQTLESFIGDVRLLSV